MEAVDMLGLGFDLYWHSPPRFADFYDLDLDLAAADRMYVPPTASDADSLSGLCASSRVDSSSPDGANSCSTAAAATPSSSSSPLPPAAVSSKNAVMGRDRRRRIDEKLYALRSVVPNITKMDKASIVRDAIAYIEHLQEQERRMLAEISALQSSAAETDAASDLPSRKKKMRRAHDGVTSSPPEHILQVQVSEAGDGVALVFVRCARGRHAVGKVCRALEPLRLRVVTVSIAAVGDTVVHALLVQTEETGSVQLKETVQSALAQLDVTRSSF